MSDSDRGETNASDAELGWQPQTADRDPSRRTRLRRRLGLTPRQWFAVETALLVAPYPAFVLVYVAMPVDELLFLTATVLYSLVATYVGFFAGYDAT